MTEIYRQSQLVKEALRQAVEAALERKRRLGQYAVILQDGQMVRIEPEQVEGQGSP